LLLLGLTSREPSAAERRALATFEAREKVVLAAPVAGRPTRGPAYSDDVVLRIEERLEEAQTLAASLDEERALEILTNVERDLLSHPELPQAAWLMAERHQLAAAIRKRQPDGAEEAQRLVASAQALEGRRAASFGESPAPAARAQVKPTLVVVRDLDPADVLVLDGRAAASAENLLPGRHHGQVLRGSRVAWSGWFDVPAKARVETSLGVPPRVACSLDDLGDVAVGSRSPSVPRGVRCQRWIGVRRGKTGLEVAWCEGQRCTAYGPLLAEQKPVPPHASLPPWAAATIVGAAAVGAVVILVATDAFERERPPPVGLVVYPGPP